MHHNYAECTCLLFTLGVFGTKHNMYKGDLLIVPTAAGCIA